jgi:hypothetical protein
MQECLFRDSFGCFDNRSRSDAKVVDEFVQLAAVWDRANRKLMHLDTFGSGVCSYTSFNARSMFTVTGRLLYIVILMCQWVCATGSWLPLK